MSDDGMRQCDCCMQGFVGLNGLDGFDGVAGLVDVVDAVDVIDGVESGGLMPHKNGGPRRGR